MLWERPSVTMGMIGWHSHVSIFLLHDAQASTRPKLDSKAHSQLSQDEACVQTLELSAAPLAWQTKQWSWACRCAWKLCGSERRASRSTSWPTLTKRCLWRWSTRASLGMPSQVGHELPLTPDLRLVDHTLSHSGTLRMHSMHLPFSWPAVIAAGSFHMSALAESDVKFSHCHCWWGIHVQSSALGAIFQLWQLLWATHQAQQSSLHSRRARGRLAMMKVSVGINCSRGHGRTHQRLCPVAVTAAIGSFEQT